LIFIW